MLKKEFVETMRKDEELHELRRKVLEITGNRADVVFRIGAGNTYEEWKEQWRKIIREHGTTS